jgi:hypothetical protein
MKIPCFILYKGKKYSKEEFLSFIQEGDNHLVLYNEFNVVAPQEQITKESPITLGERTEPLPQEKRIFKIKGDSFKIPITIEGNEVGHAIIENVEKGWMIKRIDTSDARDIIPRGSGRDAMKLLNEQAQKEGKVLISDLLDKNNNDMVKAWDKLVAEGVAEKFGEQDYAFKKPTEPAQSKDTTTPLVSDKEVESLPLAGEEVDVYDHQDQNAEEVVSRSTWRSGVWRYKFENAGDVLRELAKYKNKRIDPSYVYEKINKIESFLKQQREGVHPDDSYNAVIEKDSPNLSDIKKAYENQPVMSEAQEHARQLALSLINGDLVSAQKEIDYFNQFREGDTEANLKEVNAYPSPKSKTEQLKSKEETPVTEDAKITPTSTITDTQGENGGNVPTIEDNAQKQFPDSKIRGSQVNALIREEAPEQKIVKDAVEKNQERYNVLHGEQAVKDAQAFIEEMGVEGATTDLIEPTKDINEYPTRQVARLVLLDTYSRILGDPTANEVDKTKAYHNIDRLQTALAREGTKTGQGNAMLQLWTSMQPAGVLEFIIRKGQEFNKKQLKKKLGDSTVGQQLDDLYNTLTDANKKIIDQILKGDNISEIINNVKEKKPPVTKRYVPKEIIIKERNYRKDLIAQYKANNKTTSVSAVGLSVEQIELGGNLLASYIREGYARLSDSIDQLKKDFKGIGVNLSDDQVNDIITQKKDGQETFRSWFRKNEAQMSIRANMKDMGLRIKDIIKEHWTKKDELGRTLAQKFVDEAGVSEKDAKELESVILGEYQKLIREKSEQQLTKTLGTSKIPTKGKDRVLMDKMFEAMNMGALDSELFGQLFADKFGLTPKINQEQMTEIMRLANIVQQTSDMGWFNRDATIDLTKYIFELYPQGKVDEIFDTWIAMAYANMLSGISTSVLNLWSAGTNMAFRPFRDVVNMSKWANELRKGKNADGYNPFGEMVYTPAFRGMAYGMKEAKEVYLNGDLNNKYVENITKKSKFAVTPLERNKFGVSKRFKPFNVNISGKSYDFNIFNLYKYAGRNLSAQDKMMLNTAYDMEIVSILRDNIRETEGLSGRALTRKVMDIYKGSRVDFEALGKQIELEAQKYKDLSGKEITDLQKQIRLKELERAQLPLTPEQRLEAEKLARSNIFTDDRGGMIATLANAIGWVSNKNPILGAVIKPHIPFTKIVGNVTEYMFDYTPLYGFLRANGWSVSRLKTLVDPEAMTAQMGKRGSKAYYEQMGRAYFGLVSFGLLLALALDSDDEDFIQVTGGYAKEGFNKAGRANVTPKYTLRIGEVEIPYLNVPSLAIPLGLVGNLNDGLALGIPEEELADRFTAALCLDAVGQTVIMTKDMSLVDGTQNLLKMATDLTSMEAGAYKRTGKTLAKSYLGFATRPLPQNNNAIQQIWKFFDPTSYSQKDIKSILAYSGGLQHFVGTPTIDQLGDVVTSYPGETLMPYTHWTNIRGEDNRWKFLVDNNAIPTKIANTPIVIETKDGIQQRALEEQELYDYTLEAGKQYSKMLVEYMGNKEKVVKRQADRVTVKDNKGQEVEVTGVQDDLQTMWEKSRQNARTSLFYWGMVKETMPKEWDVIYKNKAYQPYKSSRTVGDVTLTKDQLYRYNTLATTIYAPMVAEYLNSNYVTLDKKEIENEETGESTYDIEIKNLWDDALQEADDRMEEILWVEEVNKPK